MKQSFIIHLVTIFYLISAVSLVEASSIKNKKTPRIHTHSYNNTHEVVIKGIIRKGDGDKVIKVLDSAKKDDTVYIYIKSCGGMMSEGLKIIDAMKFCKGRVIVEVVDYAQSSAALIAIHADRVLIAPGAILMFHMPRTKEFVKAKMLDDDKKLEIAARIVTDTISQYAKNVFTPKQWSRFLKGEDVYITGDTFITRFDKARRAPSLSLKQGSPWRFIKCNADFY